MTQESEVLIDSSKSTLIHRKPDSLPMPLRGLLSKKILTNAADNVIYTVPDHVKSVIASINLVNAGLVTGFINVYISSKDTPEQVDLIEFQLQVDKGKVYIRDNIKLSTSERIIITTSDSTMVVRIDGFEETN